MRHIYHLQGVTDRDEQVKAGHRQGGAFTVHEHQRGIPCTSLATTGVSGLAPTPGACVLYQDGT